MLFELSYVLKELDEAKGRTNNTAGRARLLQEMDQAFPGSAIEAPKGAEYHYDLKDPDDGHVAHAAIIGKADALVTGDTRSGLEDSPALKAASIEVLRPHIFAANTVSAHREAGVRALHELARRRAHPCLAPQQLFESLKDRHRMDEVYELLWSDV